MKVYVVHERDYHRYPILGIYTTREAAEMLMMEQGWHRDGDPKTYCEVWGVDNSEDGEPSFTIGARHYVGPIRRARIKVGENLLHRIPIDCAYYRYPGQQYVNAGLIIVGGEEPAEPQAGVDLMEVLEQFNKHFTTGASLPPLIADPCRCSKYLIVEGPVEAWNEYKAAWPSTSDDPEWIDPA